MQKSKIATIFFLIVLCIYFLFSQFYLNKLGNMYVFLINPIFFVMMSLILKFTIQSPYGLTKFRKPFIQYVLITVLSYTFIYLISGLFLTYGNNPYNTTLVGIILNIYSIGFIIFLREYIRYKLINNVQKKNKALVFTLIVIVFSLQEVQISLLVDSINIYFIFKFIFMTMVPVLIKNSLFTYMDTYTNYLPAVIYDVIVNVFLWISPILPNAPWVFTAILDSVFPLILLFYCKYNVSQKDKNHLYKLLKSTNPKGFIPIAVAIVLVIFFAIGIFPIKPIGIATGSMSPNLNVGDLVIVQKCSAKEINVNDIVEYRLKDYSVIHRVSEKIDNNGVFIFRTKGDNNSSKDADPVKEEQIVGRVIARIPYLAYPTIWITNLTNAKTNVDIQLGK